MKGIKKFNKHKKNREKVAHEKFSVLNTAKRKY